ncbi:hypothetical protein EON78_02925, partial [bacterium]
MDENLEEIEILIRARYPLIYITTWEEKRVESDLLRIATRTDKKIYSWTVTQGLVNINVSKSALLSSESSKDLLVALDNIQRSTEPALYIIKDIHHYMNDDLKDVKEETHFKIVFSDPIEMEKWKEWCKKFEGEYDYDKNNSCQRGKLPKIEMFRDEICWCDIMTYYLLHVAEYK